MGCWKVTSTRLGFLAIRDLYETKTCHCASGKEAESSMSTLTFLRQAFYPPGTPRARFSGRFKRGQLGQLPFTGWCRGHHRDAIFASLDPWEMGNKMEEHHYRFFCCKTWISIIFPPKFSKVLNKNQLSTLNFLHIFFIFETCSPSSSIIPGGSLHNLIILCKISRKEKPTPQEAAAAEAAKQLSLGQRGEVLRWVEL